MELMTVSEEESELMQLVLDEMSNPEIAEILGYGESSIKTKLGILYKKLGVKSRIGLVKVICISGLRKHFHICNNVEIK